MIPIIVALIIILADQWSKHFIQSTMYLGMSIPVIPDVFHITYILNPGAAFGILEHKTSFFVVIAVIIIIAAIYLYPKVAKQDKLTAVGIGLIVGGAIGNVIDRLNTGYVIDFLDFRIWPVFNIADIAIVTGVGIIVLIILRSSNKEDAYK